MSLTLHAAHRFDLAEVYGPRPPQEWAAILWQAEQGLSFAFRDATGRAQCVGGYVPWERFGVWECWFHAAPTAAPHMLSFVRLARLTLACVPHSDPRPIEAAILTRAGARLVAALGFRPVGTVGPVEVWRSRHGRAAGTE